jgi:hypothetical protein
MEQYVHTQGTVRLFVSRHEIYDGWTAKLYNLSKEEWLDNSEWLFDTADEAKSEAVRKAEAATHNSFANIEWEHRTT